MALDGRVQSAGRPGAIPHLREAVAAAAPGDERRLAVLALAGAQFREQRFADAVDLLDRDAAASAPALATPLAGMLDVAAAGIAIHDAAIAPAHRRRIDATRARADAEAGASPHLLGVAAFIAVLHNEPADVCAALAERALAALGGAMPAPADVLWFNQAAITLLWTERWERLDVLMDAAVAAARANGTRRSWPARWRTAAGCGSVAATWPRRKPTPGSRSRPRTSLRPCSTGSSTRACSWRR